MSEPTYWQVAAGSLDRDYSDDFLRFGMAFVGGPDQVRAMGNVIMGDRIILKDGMKKVRAVGEVISRNGQVSGQYDKDWLLDFDGWDLPAYCFVRWHKPKNVIDTHGLTRYTIQMVQKPHLKQLADEVILKYSPRSTYDVEPEPTLPVDDNKILSMLIEEGLRPAAAEELTATFVRIRRLATYYCTCCEKKDVREHETRTFLIVPLLLALGWAEQQMKIEVPVGRKRIDIACFTKPYRGKQDDDHCVLILESKGLKNGLAFAHNQAKAYASKFKNCESVVVSNGYCYKVYRREVDGSFRQEPHAYLNLFTPRDRYPIDPKNVDGALEVLRLLLPSSNPK